MPITERTEKATPCLKHGKSRVTLNWTQLSAIINGVSAIDQGSLAIRNRSDAHRFAEEYGFDLTDACDMAHIREVHREALEFIDEHFLSERQQALIPGRVRFPESVLDLLVYSSNYLNKSNDRQLWACAILKVMHGIFHIDHDFKLKYFDIIRDQIFQSLDQLIIQEGDTHMLRGVNNVKIPLYQYAKKRNKGRHSVLLKLLQKPKYVAADIYDHLGIRLIFETKAECLFALQQLRKQHLVTVTSIKPFRSRNSLVDLDQAKPIFKKYRPLLENKTQYPRDVLHKMDTELNAARTKRRNNNQDNPHSSDNYQAIQVTARKMVRLPNPTNEKLQEILKRLHQQFGEETDLISHMTADLGLDHGLTIYFDYEIQLLDKKSWYDSLEGPSSHAAYKRRQLETARKRVLGQTLLRQIQQAEGL